MSQKIEGEYFQNIALGYLFSKKNMQDTFMKENIFGLKYHTHRQT